MKVDLHVHTKERSGCARASAIEQIQAAISAGLDVIAITDHGQLQPEEEIARLNNEYAPLRILGGIELDVNGVELIVVGVRDRIIMTEKWDYAGLHAFVRAQGGLLAIPHPFRYHPDIHVPIHDFPPDAIEICSVSFPHQFADQVTELAQSLDIPMLSNSDAHITDPLGKYYNLLDSEPSDEEELMNMIKGGQFTAIMHGPDGSTREFMRLGPRAHESRRFVAEDGPQK